MIRKLELRDLPSMIEWMKDENVNCYFKDSAAKSSERDVKKFIENSFTSDNQHFAITDENDRYQGTISLKNISHEDDSAEYAIVLRASAQGKGYGYKASVDLLEYARNTLGLHRVYLNVLSNNKRAVNLYEKLNFTREGISRDAIKINGEYRTLYWYSYIFEK